MVHKEFCYESITFSLQVPQISLHGPDSQLTRLFHYLGYPVILSTREFSQPPVTAPTPSSLVVAEGIPPVSHKLVEKIRKWEYIELSSLLEDHYPPDQMALFNGQLMVISSSSQRRRQAAVISDILSWLQAFSIYTAILVSSETTTKEEAAGLAAHTYLILQLSKDLKGSQWLKYDQSYREWAAAKGIRKWGEINFSIYGRCLASQQTSTTYYPPSSMGKSLKRKAITKVCYRWNGGVHCDSSTCRFHHCCRFCRGSHQAIGCPQAPKRA